MELQKKYEANLLDSPNTKQLKYSMLYNMDTVDEKKVKNKLTHLLKKNFVYKDITIKASVPVPRDGTAFCCYADKYLVVFGGDRNKYPFNDMYYFELK